MVSQSNSRIKLPSVLRLYWLVTISLTILSVLTTFLFTHVLHRVEYPYARTLLPPEYFHVDFLCYADRFHYFHQDRFFSGPHRQPFNYPAPVALAYEFFYLAFPNPVLAFAVVTVVSLLVAAALFTKKLIHHGLGAWTAATFALTALASSYPFILMYYLSNMEFAVWLTLALGVWAYAYDRSWCAATCFGLSASLKIYPIIYLGLLLSRKQYKQAVLGLVVCACSLTASFAILGPTTSEALRGVANGIRVFNHIYIDRFNPLESGIDHSLFDAVKLCAIKLGHSLNHSYSLNALAGRYLITVAALGIILYIWRIRFLPVTNQILALGIAAILLPPVSHDYTLTHLYAPWVMLVLSVLDRERQRLITGPQPFRTRSAHWEMTAIFACFALLFTSQNYLIVENVRVAGQLKAITLLALFIFALKTPLRTKWDRPQSSHELTGNAHQPA